MGNKFSRRTVLKGLGSVPLGLGAAASPLAVLPAFGADKPFTVCGSWELTAPGIANTAMLCDRGSRLAVEHLSAKLGLKASYTNIDTEGDPGKGVRKVNEQITQRGIKFFVGGASSAVALAVSREVEKGGGVYVTTGGADELTGANCSKSTFRWPVATYGAVERTVRPLLDQIPKAKRWFTITPKFVFGEALLRNTRRVLAEKGAEHVGNVYHGLAEREFSGYLTEAMAAKPDVLCLLSFSGQTIDQLRQAADFGLKNNMTILVIWSAGLDQYRAIGADILKDVYIGAQYWHRVDTAQNRELVPLFQKAFKSPPTYSEMSGYTLTRLILEGAAKAKSADPGQVIAAIKGLKYDGPTGPEEVRAFDHQCIKDYYLFKGKAASAMSDADDFLELVSAGKAFVQQSESECKAI